MRHFTKEVKIFLLLALLSGCARQVSPEFPDTAHEVTASPLAVGDLRITASSVDTNAGSSAGGAVDGQFGTWWGTNAVGGALRLDPGTTSTVSAVRIAFYKGSSRSATFDLQVTTSATITSTTSWTTVTTRTSSGATNDFQRFVLPAPVSARHLRLVNRGTSTGSATAFTEVAIEGSATTGGTSGWSVKAPAPLKRWESQGLAAEGQLFTFGGFRNTPDIAVYATRESYRFSVASNTWTRIADLPEPITHAGQALDEQRRTIYLAGGFVGNGYTKTNPIVTTAKVWKYDLATNSWSAAPSLPAPRAAGVLVRRGRFLHYFAGTVRTGDSYGGDYNSHWALNLDQPSQGWQRKAPYPLAVNHLSGAVVGETIYGLGGQRSDAETSTNTSAVYAYDPAGDRWTAAGGVAPMPRPLGHAGASTFVRDGRIIVVGGVTNDPQSIRGGREVANVVMYRPDTNRWTELTPLPSPRQSPVADLVSGVMVATTGDGADKAPHDETWTRPWSP
ncbi:Kelch repeat-containing protein [Deinococcus peraridilitoris]|uniref:F5/8 type C domain-containing protein n=1 Tax=Deinococcus peraridilitoris (strain DSM 19664 / LMG 22246 / CIP 109416 / KR-200) TaxID=937777 RepID=L0A538_DEIPD|nr:kelch repeat-containing protein [Deinococcus peraridilitoris]AFZ68100.1 hypothetical protein Deipe_2635 [Deinococcus peraridilitoris DSM 19664]